MATVIFFGYGGNFTCASSGSVASGCFFLERVGVDEDRQFLALGLANLLVEQAEHFLERTSGSGSPSCRSAFGKQLVDVGRFRAALRRRRAELLTSYFSLRSFVDGLPRRQRREVDGGSSANGTCDFSTSSITDRKRSSRSRLSSWYFCRLYAASTWS